MAPLASTSATAMPMQIASISAVPQGGGPCQSGARSLATWVTGHLGHWPPGSLPTCTTALTIASLLEMESSKAC